MTGLLQKTVREAWLPTLIFGVALMLIMALLTHITPQVQNGVGDLLDQLPFAKTMIATLLGTELGEEINAHTMKVLLWVHPTVLALIWGHAIVLCTRVPAGEIDRGTVDVLLGLPVSRRAVFYGEVVVWLAAGVVLFLLGWLGHLATVSGVPEPTRTSPLQALIVMANLYCVYFAAGGVAFLVSSLSNSRGRAMGVAFAVVMVSFLLSFVAQFWEPAKAVSFVSVLEYYRPAEVIRGGGFPVADVATLAAVGALCLIAGGEVFSRRSITTV